VDRLPLHHAWRDPRLRRRDREGDALRWSVSTPTRWGVPGGEGTTKAFHQWVKVTSGPVVELGNNDGVAASGIPGVQDFKVARLSAS
jgi:hypothetical protein